MKQQEQTPAVVIGMDPHKRSVTVEVMTADETIVGHARFGTDRAGYMEPLAYAPLAAADVGDRGLRRHRPARRGPAAAAG